MLTSFFGDLLPARRSPAAAPVATDSRPFDATSDVQAFAATAIFDRRTDDDAADGSTRDKRSNEWVIDGAPAEAVRRHLATTRPNLGAASSLITLFDPVALWAPAVVKALSDVGGQPVQRLLLREHGTLRPLAVIERTSLPRRQGNPLRLCHADTQVAAGSDPTPVSLALMERSQLAAVIVGPLTAPAVDGLLAELLRAAQQPGWACPHLLFMLPPGAVWIANRIDALDWPTALTVIQRDEVLSSVSAVWNALLGAWDELHPQPAAGAVGPTFVTPSGAGGLADAAATAPAALDIDLAMPLATPTPPAAALPAALRARQSLAGLLQVDGLLACAVVDGRNGAVIARETREDQPVDLDLAAAASAQALRAHRLSARAMGANDGVDELIVSAGTRQLMLRNSPSHPDVFVLALLDRERADPGLARLKLLEVERRLA